MQNKRPIASDRIDSFESLRGIMALWVLLGHVTLTFTIPSLEHFSLWQILGENGRAVYVFMILSGFVIFYLLHTKDEDYKLYIFRRFLRIFPAYFICLLISAAMLPISLGAATAFSTISSRNLGRVGYLTDSIEHFIPHFFAHLTMLHGLIPGRMLSHSEWAILGQAWSISVEWQFYLLAPLFLLIIRQKSRVRAIAGLFILLFPLAILARKLGDGFIGGHLLYFATGCASALYWFNTPKWNRLITRHPNYTIPISILISLILMPDRWELAIWAAIFVATLSLRENGDKISLATIIYHSLNWPPLRYLGKISYSIYLVHMIPLFGTLWLLKDTSFSAITLFSITLASTIGFTLLLSACIYRWIEAPFIQIGKLCTTNRHAA